VRPSKSPGLPLHRRALRSLRRLDFRLVIFHDASAISPLMESKIGAQSVERHGCSRVHGGHPGAARVSPPLPAIPVFPGKWFLDRVARLDSWPLQTCRTPIQDARTVRLWSLRSNLLQLLNFLKLGNIGKILRPSGRALHCDQRFTTDNGDFSSSPICSHLATVYSCPKRKGS